MMAIMKMHYEQNKNNSRVLSYLNAHVRNGHNAHILLIYGAASNLTHGLSVVEANSAICTTCHNAVGIKR